VRTNDSGAGLEKYTGSGFAALPGRKPSLVIASLWQMPQASTMIRTSPGAGSKIFARRFQMGHQVLPLARRASSIPPREPY